MSHHSISQGDSSRDPDSRMIVPASRRLGHPASIAPDLVSLLHKYDRLGPRYTSYPPATEFRPMTSAEYLAAVNESRFAAGQTESIAPVSLYLHVPFCQSPCFYCGCNKIITRNHSAVREYLDHLRKEMALNRLQMNVYKRPVTQLHWGGGTPTFLDDAEMTELMHQTANYFHLTNQENRDYSIEVDPRTVDVARINLLRGLGFNRISLGVQDFDESVQKAINRVQPFEQVEELMGCIRQRAFRSVNFDLIYGLPLQTVSSIERTLEQVVALSPDRISYYNYAHLPDRFPAQQAIDSAQLPTAAEKIRMISTIVARLTEAGYLYVGMDHFVRPDDPLAQALHESRLCRNFQGYSVDKAEDLVGLGVSAISQVANVYAQNYPQLDTYYKLLEANQLPVVKGLVPTAEDLLRDDIIQQITCYREVNIPAVEARHNIHFREHFADVLLALEQFSDDGLVQVQEEHSIVVTPAGNLLLRNICMLFDEYLWCGSPSRPAFSRVI